MDFPGREELLRIAVMWNAAVPGVLDLLEIKGAVGKLLALEMRSAARASEDLYLTAAIRRLNTGVPAEYHVSHFEARGVALEFQGYYEGKSSSEPVQGSPKVESQEQGMSEKECDEARMSLVQRFVALVALLKPQVLKELSIAQQIAAGS